MKSNEDKNPAAVSLGTLGGKAKSRKKSLSSKKNGKLGGRPKKKSDAAMKIL